MKEGTTQVYALLPYVVEEANAACERRVAAGQELPVRFSLSCRGGKAGRHILRLDVAGPDGKLREHYGANVETTEG